MKYLKTYKIYESFHTMETGSLYKDYRDNEIVINILGNYVYILDAGGNIYTSSHIFDRYSSDVFDSFFKPLDISLEDYLKKNPGQIKYIISSFNEIQASQKIGSDIKIVVGDLYNRIVNNPEFKKYIELDQLGIL